VKKLTLSIVMLLYCGEAGAQSIRVKDYLNPSNNTSSFVAGVKDGLIAYNAIGGLVFGGGRQLFCIPPNHELTVEQANDILRQWLEKRKTKEIGDLQISMAMLQALRETFPCQK
jgi:hypothetical protein